MINLTSEFEFRITGTSPKGCIWFTATRTNAYLLIYELAGGYPQHVLTVHSKAADVDFDYRWNDPGEHLCDWLAELRPAH